MYSVRTDSGLRMFEADRHMFIMSGLMRTYSIRCPGVGIHVDILPVHITSAIHYVTIYPASSVLPLLPPA